MRDADELHEALCGLGLLACTVGEAAALRRRPRRRQARHHPPHRRPRFLGRRGTTRTGPPRLPRRCRRSADRRAARCPRDPGKPGSLRRRNPARLVRMLRPADAPRTLPASSPCRATWWTRRWRNSKPKARFCAASFTAAAGDVEWCHRRLLARIHRLTIGRLRREIEPVTTAEFYAFLRPLAAPRARQPTARRGWHAADHPPAAGLRIPGGRVGDRRFCRAAWRATSPSTSTSSASRAK